MNEILKEGRNNHFIYKSGTAKVTVITCDFNCILHFTPGDKNRQKEERQCILIIVFGRFSYAYINFQI